MVRPVVRIALKSGLMVMRSLLWVACSLLVALFVFVSFTLPSVAKEGLSGRIARTWDGSIAWLDLEVFDQRYLATESVTFVVDPNCMTALGHADYQAVVGCGKECAKYPRPACGPKRSRSPHKR
jgi:hypothetical protein